jgi:hypothetical protein
MYSIVVAVLAVVASTMISVTTRIYNTYLYRIVILVQNLRLHRINIQKEQRRISITITNSRIGATQKSKLLAAITSDRSRRDLRMDSRKPDMKQ